MLYRKLVALVLLLAVVHAATVAAQPAQPDSATAAQPTRLLIGFKPDAQPADQDAALQAVGLSRAQVVNEIPQIHTIAVDVPSSGLATDELIAQLTAQQGVAYAEVSTEIRLIEPIETAPGTQDVPQDAPIDLTQTFVPNDPLLNTQYALTILQARSAWGVTQGERSVVIAVVDTGVLATHVDLNAQLVPGKNFVGSGTSTNDTNGHGTAVSGVIAAATNNERGIAGMCPNCRIMPMRAFGTSGSTTNEIVAAAVTAAADAKVQIINLSLGGSTDSKVLRDAVNYAWNKGAFLVCAAGNSGSPSRTFPAGYRNCFSVGATDSSDAKASFSNYGTWVYATAPGRLIRTTSFTGSYEDANGTSFSAPYVAGVAGLLASQNLNNAQIRDRLCGTADKIAGTGSLWYCGRINASRAVRETTANQTPFRAVFLPLVGR